MKTSEFSLKHLIKLLSFSNSSFHFRTIPKTENSEIKIPESYKFVWTLLPWWKQPLNPSLTAIFETTISLFNLHTWEYKKKHYNHSESARWLEQIWISFFTLSGLEAKHCIFDWEWD